MVLNKVKNEFLFISSLERKTQELEIIKLQKSLKLERQNVDKIKNKYEAMKVSNEVLRRKISTLEKEKKFVEIRLRIKEEEVADFVTYNKPLEKAYKSLQRRYVKVSDSLDSVKQDIEKFHHI